MGISWLHKIVHYVTWGQDLATCGCQVERSNFGCLGSSLVWITGRDAGVRPIVADQPKLEPLLATRRRGFRNNIPALRARHTCPPSCSWVLFANISNNSICSSEITFELFQKFRDFCGWQAKTRRNRFSMDFSVCLPRSKMALAKALRRGDYSNDRYKLISLSENSTFNNSKHLWKLQRQQQLKEKAW